MGESFDYRDAETPFRGYLARPDEPGRRPGILVVHDAPGLGDYIRRRTDMLAALGFVALAADLYGSGQLASGAETAIAWMRALQADPDQHRQRLATSLEALAGLPFVDRTKLAAVGYCAGGQGVLELARSGAAVAGVVSFHGLLDTARPAEPGAVRCRILACTGAEDPLVPPEQVAGFTEEMGRAGADWQLVTYGGAQHAFTNPAADAVGYPGLAYDGRADRRSWLAMQAFLAEIFE
ncbi:MAG: dienelactone hydrolase-like enzyme [Bradyrhizobium sp.]|nr:dienelactone hydrolase-like enzyme [Bradyrhizobium sp.]